jgi:hypothetical protein
LSGKRKLRRRKGGKPIQKPKTDNANVPFQDRRGTQNPAHEKAAHKPTAGDNKAVQKAGRGRTAKNLKAGTPRTAQRNNQPEEGSKLKSALWGFIWFLLGTLAGPVIQQWFFTLLPGPKVSATLTADHVPGNPNCTYYKFVLANFRPIGHMYAKMQFPDPITSVSVGNSTEIVQDNDHRQGQLSFEKGPDDEGKCSIKHSSLTPNPDIQSTWSGHVIEIRSSAQLPLMTQVVGLVATTGSSSGQAKASPQLWTESTYQISEFGQIIEKKMPIEIHDLFPAPN